MLPRDVNSMTGGSGGKRNRAETDCQPAGSLPVGASHTLADPNLIAGDWEHYTDQILREIPRESSHGPEDAWAWWEQQQG